MQNKRIAIYSRKSKYVEGSESIENQIEMCKDYIKKHLKDEPNIFTYEDEGYSGGNIKRPQFQKLLKDAKNNKFDVLICYRLDRISRNIADFSSIINMLQNHNIDFISIREQFDTTTPMGRAMMYIASVFAQLERETIAERVRDNMMEMAKGGKWTGGTPALGYKIVNKKLVINEEEKAIVEDMYDKYLELGSLSKVFAYCCDKYKNRGGTVFDAASIRWILTNPTYVVADENIYNYFKEKKSIICNTSEEFKNSKNNGVMPYNRTKRNLTRIKQRDYTEWIIAIGQHKGFLTSEKWLQVEKLIVENKDKSPRAGKSHVTLLNGLLKCKKCGGPMRAIYKYNKDKVMYTYYYRCINKEISRGKLCKNKNINGPKIEKKVLDYIIKIGTNDELLYELYDINKDIINNCSSNIDQEIADTEKRIQKNRSDIEKLTEKLILAEGSAASKYIVSKIEKIDAEIKSLTLKLNGLSDANEEKESIKVNFDILKQEIAYLSENIDELGLEEKRRLLKAIIKTIDWDGEDLDIHIK